MRRRHHASQPGSGKQGTGNDRTASVQGQVRAKREKRRGMCPAWQPASGNAHVRTKVLASAWHKGSGRPWRVSAGQPSLMVRREAGRTADFLTNQRMVWSSSGHNVASSPSSYPPKVPDPVDREKHLLSPIRQFSGRKDRSAEDSPNGFWLFNSTGQRKRKSEAEGAETHPDSASYTS